MTRTQTVQQWSIVLLITLMYSVNSFGACHTSPAEPSAFGKPLPEYDSISRLKINGSDLAHRNYSSVKGHELIYRGPAKGLNMSYGPYIDIDGKNIRVEARFIISSSYWVLGRENIWRFSLDYLLTNQGARNEYGRHEINLQSPRTERETFTLPVLTCDSPVSGLEARVDEALGDYLFFAIDSLELVIQTSKRKALPTVIKEEEHEDNHDAK